MIIITPNLNGQNAENMLRLSLVYQCNQSLGVQARKKLNGCLLSGWQPAHKSILYFDHHKFYNHMSK